MYLIVAKSRNRELEEAVRLKENQVKEKDKHIAHLTRQKCSVDMVPSHNLNLLL